MLIRELTKPFMAPSFHESCCGAQSWLVDGRFWAAELWVSAWNGYRYPSGLSESACLKTPGMAVGSPKPRTPGMAPK